MKETNYKETLEWLYRQLPMFSRVGAAAYKPGLETSYRLDDFFGNPHKKFRSVHVGGTNGKGSTSHWLASILKEAGYKTGLYTSPHLVDFRERIRINGRMIPESDVIDFVGRFKESGYEGKPSFFELTMMMAFDWFAKEKVEVAVIEVGMGGRLDSTNIITPEISVITNISKDHTQFLGDTFEKIAGEKAGIIKSNIPVVIGERGTKEVEEVFKKKAIEENTSIYFSEDYSEKFGLKREGWQGTVNLDEIEIKIPLHGDYQKKNIATVLTVVERLREKGYNLNVEAVKRGIENVIENTGFMGRWMILDNSPRVIADTGHNEAGITYNITQLRRLLTEKPSSRLLFIVGFVADKAIDEIIDLLPEEATYYVTNASIPRALPYKELIKKFISKGLKATGYENVASAFDGAKAEANPDDIIFIGGSTFIVADFLATRK